MRPAGLNWNVDPEDHPDSVPCRKSPIRSATASSSFSSYAPTAPCTSSTPSASHIPVGIGTPNGYNSVPALRCRSTGQGLRVNWHGHAVDDTGRDSFLSCPTESSAPHPSTRSRFRQRHQSLPLRLPELRRTPHPSEWIFPWRLQ